MSLLYTLTDSVTDATGLATAEADILIEEVGHPYVLALYDSAKPQSWAGTAVTNGNTVSDLTRHARTGTWVNSPAVTVSTTGGGWDFSAATDIGPYFSASANIANTLWNAGSNHHWMMVVWAKVPASAEFGTTTGKICPIISFADAAPTSAGNEEIGGLYWYRDGTGNRVYYARKEAATTWNYGYLNPTSDHYGKVSQIAVWWDGTSIKASLKTLDGNALTDTTASTGSNSENFSAQTLKVGPIKSWPTNVPLTGDMKDWRLYRAAVVDLTGAGITDPTDVLAAEYTIVSSRGAFS